MLQLCFDFIMLLALLTYFVLHELLFFAEEITTTVETTTTTEKVTNVPSKSKHFTRNNFNLYYLYSQDSIILTHQYLQINFQINVFFLSIPVLGDAPKAKPVSPFAKFRQLDKQNSTQSAPRYAPPAITHLPHIYLLSLSFVFCDF